MTSTNFTKFPIHAAALCGLIFFFGAVRISHAQVMVCNNLVHASVDNTPNICQAGLNADQILEGTPIPGHTYFIEVMDNIFPVVSGNNQVSIPNASQYFNHNLTVKITNVTGGGNACWGQVKVEDKLAPVLTCTPATILCSDDINVVGAPTAVDNCTANPTINLTGETTNTNTLCTNNFVTVTRHYVAIDASGNTSAPCQKVITVSRPTAVDFPNDINWTCEQYAAFPNIIAATAKHPYVGDSQPSTSLIIDVNLNPQCDDNDPSSDEPSINSTNAQNGGTGCPGSGLDDVDVLALTGSGVVANIIGQHCNYQQSKSDQVVAICGTSFKVVRTWTVINWCTGQIITTGVGGEDNVQVIKVMDNTKPVITRPPFNVSANIPGQHPQPCRSMGFLEPPVSISDNCNTYTLKILTTVGEAIYLGGNPLNGGMIPSPGLALGNHNVTYQVTDACNNILNLTVPITVVDDIAPTMVCIEYLDVNITTGGSATVFANSFTSGAYDNCCIDHYEVRRMIDPCADGHDDTLFGPSVVFCCNDVANSPVMVVVRGVDCFGNTGECMVEVFVNDKLHPTLVSCPPNQRISCDWYADNLETQLAGLNNVQQCSLMTAKGFGNATYYDNCAATVSCNVTFNLDQCLEGTLTRTFSAKDASNNSSVQPCTQVINVDHVSDWAVEFPADITVNCGTTPPAFGEPEIFYETCELVAVNYDDEVFNVVADACYKIVRTWTIINWCAVGADVNQEVVEQPENQLGLAFPACDIDNDGDCDGRTFRDSWRGSVPVPNPFAPTAYRLRPTAVDAHTPSTNPVLNFRNPDTDVDTDPWDGFITYQQTIKVNDAVDPVFANNCVVPDVCIEGNSCVTNLILPTPDIDDCSPNLTITAQVNFGGIWVSGLGPFNNVGPGTYVVRYNVKDNCNNQSECTTTLAVKDCKKPTPYCRNGLVVELMQTGMVEVWASDLNSGSFDNCPGTLKYSFSSDVNDLGEVFTCDDLGTNPVQMWVTDAAGNQDYCETFVVIQDNMMACNNSGDPLIAGTIANEDDLAVEGVTVGINPVGGTSLQVVTGSNGGYAFFNNFNGQDVTITPSHDEYPMNGVSTFDLVLISKHILGSTPLGSPYKIIAADANRSNSVTTFDLVEIRKLILQINDNFPNNTSWRFVPSDFVFPNPAAPFSAPFPEVINENDFGNNQVLNYDFVAIKTGDVNNSAAVNLMGQNEERSNGKFALNAEDRQIVKGEQITVDFNAADLELLGFQFSLNFDVNALEFVDLKSGVAGDENFGFKHINKGVLTASWHGAATERKMFSLVFRAKQQGRLSDYISINSSLTKAEAYRTNGDLMEVQLAFDTRTELQFALYQNTPNPFSGVTTIGFNLPSAGTGSLTLTDISGKVVKRIEREFVTGYNEIRLTRDELPASGVIYYTLKTSNDTATKKMVIVD
ncbi:MAG: T9SS type A sorting domain-containing protein [Saprospiraceae bacterium]|nr:T9SS type A sorting domain-containing protein [Saprospiraceae bacterium]